jgi:hypothetical protein
MKLSMIIPLGDARLYEKSTLVEKEEVGKLKAAIQDLHTIS